MRNVTATFKNAMFAQQTGEVFLVLLTISHSDLPEDITLVSNQEAVISNGVTYQPYAFGMDLPGDEEGRVGTARLVIDNTDRMIVEAVRSINDAPTIEVSIVLSSDPDTIEVGPFEFHLRNVSFNESEVVGDLYFQERLNREVPVHRMIARDFPALYL